MPPGLALLVCTWLAYPIVARTGATEWTRRDLIVQRFWSLAGWQIPVCLFQTAFGATLDNAFQRAILWFVAAFVALNFGGRQLLRATQYNRQALTFGELRDRLFHLAGAAKVKINQIYFLPAGKGRAINAFALHGNDVLLTDYLLRNLSKREVDAIAGHEITHLRHKHPMKLLRVGLLCGAIPTLILLTACVVRGWDFYRTLAFAPLVVLLSQFVIYFVSRRFERIADAGAVTLTGDPEATITGLVKITRLNHLPIDWGRATERTLTHPSTERRAEAVAQRAGIPPERLRTLLESPDADPERYPIPAGIDEKRIFSTTYKIWEQFRLVWTHIGAILFPVAAFAWLGERLALAAPALWFVWLAGFAASVGALLASLNYAGAGGAQRLRKQLAERLAREGIAIDREAAVFVDLSPGGEPRIYEGSNRWDIGFLIFTPERLLYIGELARFALRRDQIREVTVEKGWPSWLPALGVRIAWRDPDTSAEGQMLVWNGAEGSQLRTTHAVRALFRRIEVWRQAPPNGTPPAGQDTSHPDALEEGRQPPPEETAPARVAASPLESLGPPAQVQVTSEPVSVESQSAPDRQLYRAACHAGRRAEFAVRPLVLTRSRQRLLRHGRRRRHGADPIAAFNENGAGVGYPPGAASAP